MNKTRSLSKLSKELHKDSKRQRERFIDWKRVKVVGGDGGDGCMSFRRERYLPWGGPNGGNGGRGGAVSLMAVSRLKSLKSLRFKYKAQDGGNGEGMDRQGFKGKDTVIEVPIGTTIKEEGRVIADLCSEGMKFTVANGGTGGHGNARFATPEAQSPHEATCGSPGEEKTIEIELKTIADIGLVGFPNAGKSTLLRCISRARPRVASYPFTTLNPHIGVVATPDGTTRLTVADIPGIIPGAHKNIGLGHSFLRHIERCHSLLYVLDPASHTLPDKLTATQQNSSLNLFQQLVLLQRELKEYDSTLMDKHQMIIVNKMDINGAEECVRELHNQTNLSIIPISGLHRQNIDCLTDILLHEHKRKIKLN